MPIDPSIPLSVQTPQLDVGAIIGNAYQLKQMQQQMATQNALKAIFAEPDAVDAKTGQPTANTLAKVTRIDPNAGMKLTASVAEADERKAQTEHAQSETQAARAKAYRDQLSEYLGVYDAELKGGDIDPKEAERTLKTSIRDYLYNDSSLPRDQRDALWSKAEAMSPTQLRAITLTADQRAAQAEEQRKESEEMTLGEMNGRPVLFNKKGEVFDPNTRKKIEVGAPVFKPGAVMDPTRLAIEEKRLGVAERAEALKEKLASGGAADLTDDDVSFAAEMLLNGQPMPNMGYGAAGAAARKRILHKAAEMAGEENGSPAAGADAAVVRKEALAADKASLTAATKQQQSVRQFSQTALGLADKVDGLVDKVAAQGPEAWAKFVQHVKLRYAADPQAKEFLGYVTDLQSENAKIMAGATGSVAQVSASNQDMMNHILSGDLPASEIKGSLRSIREGIRMRNESVNDEVARQRTQMGADTAGGGRHAASSEIAHPTSKAEYDALPSGAHYSKPGDPPGTYRVKR